MSWLKVFGGFALFGATIWGGTHLILSHIEAGDSCYDLAVDVADDPQVQAAMKDNFLSVNECDTVLKVWNARHPDIGKQHDIQEFHERVQELNNHA